MKSQELKAQLFALNGLNQIILNGFDNLELDNNPGEDDISYETYSNIVSFIAYADHLLSYLQRPVKTEGILIAYKNRRLKLNKFILKDGDMVEIFLDEDSKWRLITLEEYDMFKYEGVRARIRK